MLTDIKHVFSVNPLRPVYRGARAPLGGRAPAASWAGCASAAASAGSVTTASGFAFDNEGPRHRVFLQPFELATRLVTNGEYLEFMDDGGYERPELWLSDGLGHGAGERLVGAPLYWEKRDGEWWIFTLAGMRPVDPAEPVMPRQLFRGRRLRPLGGRRLPTEAEWESAAAAPARIEGNFVEGGALPPGARRAPGGAACSRCSATSGSGPGSPYTPYPGYTPPAGALGEYNGKFMCNQFVLRGGSCATLEAHIRPDLPQLLPARRHAGSSPG